MDPRSINFASRRNLGFFLTRGKESDGNRDEHEFFAASARKCADLLREKRVRPNNVVSDLSKLDEVIQLLASFIQEQAVRMGFEDVQSTGGARAYASLIVSAALSRYASLMEKRKEEAKEGGK
jgi:hypothetical protein